MNHAFLKKTTNTLRNNLGTFMRNRNTRQVILNFNEFLQNPGLNNVVNPEKMALVSYLVEPLLPSQGKRDTSTFSNAGIAQYIPRALNELGYTVDIINYDNKRFVPNKKYDLFIGHGGINFETIVKKLDDACITIYFSTGTYWKEWNRVEKERLDALQKRRGVTLPADRQIEQDEEYANVNSDGIICLGNDHAKKTYDKYSHVINVNNAVYSDTYIPSNKNFNTSRNNFLFFNGRGNVHKGLDLLLEAFTTQTEQHLYVRQNIESDFFKAYEKELTEYSNIHIVPYLEKPSKEFFSLMDTCNFVISPTCAEGQPGSIIECMAHGLIPILSKEANIDTKDFGITLTENSVNEIIQTIKIVSEKPTEWHKSMSNLTINEIQNNYLPEHFLKNMNTAIHEIVKSRTNQ